MMLAKRPLLFLVLFLAFAMPGWGATIYVNPATGYTSVNGYGDGDNARDRATAASKSTPVATITRAEAIAQAGDTIMINGVTATPITYTEAASITVNAGANLTIQCEEPLGAIWTTVNGQTKVARIDDLATGLTIGSVIIDGRNQIAACIDTDTATDVVSLTIDGTCFRDPTTYFINTQAAAHLQNLTMGGNWTATSTGGAAMIVSFYLNGGATANGTYLIHDGTVTQSGMDSDGNRSFAFNPVITGLNVDMHDITINKTIAATGGIADGVYSAGGVSNFLIHDIVFSYTGVGATTTVSAVNISNHATLTTDSLEVYNLSGSLGQTATGSGYLVKIGDEIDGGKSNHITNPTVHDCDLSDSNHGYMMGYVTGGKIYNNKGNNLSIGAIFKGCVNGSAYNNIFTNIGTGGALRTKTSTNSLYYNNTCTLASSGVGIMSSDTDVSATWRNNIVWTDQSTMQFVNIESGTTGTLDNNCYYSTKELPANAWQAAASTYATLALWRGATGTPDTHGLNEDPQFRSTTDFHIKGTSPCKNTGMDLGETYRYDYDGKDRYIGTQIGVQ